MKSGVFVLAIILVGTIVLPTSICPAQTKIKHASVSGVFYPEDSRALTDLIDSYLESVNLEQKFSDIKAMITPHAGYIYSGIVAAHAFKAISAFHEIKTAVIIGPSHYQPPRDLIGIYPRGYFRTPLGDIGIDEVLAEKLISSNDLIRDLPQYFDKEHSIEVQLPFLQRTLKNCRIVPLAINSDSYELCESLAQSLANLIQNDPGIIIIVSSDLSHYHPQEQARMIDAKTLELIREFKIKELHAKLSAGSCEACGRAGIITLLLTLEKLGVKHATILDYATSADTTNSPETKVVGYASVVFSKNNPEPINNPERKIDMITESQKKALLQTARSAITEFVTNKRNLSEFPDDPLFREKRGAFVTLHKDNNLRGCIGRIIPDKPLIEVISEMAVAAAVEDPRFPAVLKNEVPHLSIEISVLSPIKKITDISEIKVGTHGLIIKKGFYSGLLLPQVASDYNWSREEFLRQTCRKAGLDSDAWKTGAEMFIFSAEVFSESD